jgi:hypothetical protein
MNHLPLLSRALLYAAAFLLAAPVAATAGQLHAERPTYSVGDKWVRSDGTYELVRIEDGLYVFSARPGQEIHLTRDLAVAKVLRAGQLVALDPPPRLEWPLEVGKWGSGSATWRMPDFPSGVDATVAWSVDGVDEVRVPAGTFQAFRIAISITPTSSQVRNRWAGLTSKIWYAPAAKQYVKAEGRFETGLGDFSVLSVEPGTPAPPRVASPAPAARPPPRIELRFPEDQARLATAETVVAAAITSERGVAMVTVSVNGTRVHETSEPSPQASVLVTVPVKLRDGGNRIELQARDADGRVATATRTVTFEPPRTAAPPPPPPAAPVKNRWAVVIGIGRYDRPQIPTLEYSVADAEQFYDVLIRKAGFKKENTLLLTDKTERRPTLRNIKWALGTFLSRTAQKDDLVVIYYAGHGAPEIDPRGIESDGLAKYLVPIDADPDDLYSTGFPMDEMQTIFSRIEADQVVVFLDACYSGAAGGRTFASRRTRTSRVDDLFLDRLTRSKGRVIVSAARTSEVSLELPDLGHGLFTYYLIRGVQGTADLDRDGIVSLQELYQYLEQQVSQKSRAAGGNQHPVMKGELEGVLPLAKVGR